MKPIHKTVISVLIVLMLATTVVYAKNVKDANRIAAPEDKIPEMMESSLVIDPSIATTYSDIWADTNAEYLQVIPFENIEVMSKNITLRYPSTVVVQFSSEIWQILSKDQRIWLGVWVEIDGNMMLPGNVMFSENVEGWQTNSFSFKREYVSAGPHKIRIVVRRFDNGEELRLYYKSMIIFANGYGH